MKKNKKPAAANAKPAVEPNKPLLSRQSLQLIGSGIVILVIGYSVLSFADSRAQNLPGKLSPFLILGGYVLIGIGLLKNKPA